MGERKTKTERETITETWRDIRRRGSVLAETWQYVTVVKVEIPLGKI